MKNIVKNLVLMLACINYVSSYSKSSNKKIIIGGVGKNIEHCLPTMIDKIEKLGGRYADYTVIIYENNSSDKSAAMLKQWAEQNPHVHCICEYVSPEELHLRTRSHAKLDQAPCRMELIAYGRNRVLSEILSDAYHDVDYVIMTDLDFIRGWSVDDVVKACAREGDWHAITANGIDGSGYFYDRYAYRDDRFLLGPELIGEDFWYELSRTPIMFRRGSELKKIYSGFGGIAIYKRAALIGCRYDGYVTQDLKNFMEHILNNVMKKNHPHYGIYKKIVGNKRSLLPVIFQTNCGYDGPVACEHSTLHATMFLNGFENIYVDPDLVCIY